MIRVIFLTVVLAIQPASSTFYTHSREGMEKTIDKLEKEHGMIVKEIYSVAGTMGHDCISTLLDFSPFVDGLRTSVKDLFAELDAPGDTPEETEMINKRRETLENALKDQENYLEKELEEELSSYWGSEVNGQAEYAWTSLSVGYEIRDPKPQLYLHETIREGIKKDLEAKNGISDLFFRQNLRSMFSSYQRSLKMRFDGMLRKLSMGSVPREIFKGEEDIKQLVSSASVRNYYERSIYRLAPFDTLSMMSSLTMSRTSKLEIMTDICFDLYTSDSNQMLLKIETKPKIKENYYVQSVLPNYIVVEDSEQNFKMVGTIATEDKKNMIIGGTFCGKVYLLPEDCNVLERKGCAHVITPKKTFEAPKLADKTVRLERKNGKTAKDHKMDL